MTYIILKNHKNEKLKKRAKKNIVGLEKNCTFTALNSVRAGKVGRLRTIRSKVDIIY